MNYVQNFTIEDSFKGTPIYPGETFSLAFDFFPFTSLPAPNSYTLLLAVFYTDSNYEYSSLVFYKEVHVAESEQVGIVSGLFSLLFSGTILFIIGFTIYVRIQERFFPTAPGAKKRKTEGGLLETMRGLVSSGAQPEK